MASPNTFEALAKIWNLLASTQINSQDRAAYNDTARRFSELRSGVGTLAGAPLTVNDETVTADSIILVTSQDPIGITGSLAEDKANRVPGTSFDVVSTVGADAGDFAYFIIG